MGLITGLLTLPLAPVRGVVWIAEQLQRAAEAELGEEGLRRRLVELQLARDQGALGPEEYSAAEAELIDRLLAALPPEAREDGSHG